MKSQTQRWPQRRNRLAATVYPWLLSQDTATSPHQAASRSSMDSPLSDTWVVLPSVRRPLTPVGEPCRFESVNIVVGL